MTAAPKVDLRRELPSYAARKGRFDLVRVPPLRYLALDGQGDPNTSRAYADALTTLYPVAYRLKFLSKRALGRDYVVPPLEATWTADDLAAFTTARDKSRWHWTVLNLVPAWVGDEHVAAVRAELAAKGDDLPSLADLRLDTLEEGLVVQTLHVGPYDDEGPVLERMHSEEIPGRGLVPTGRHHEIYLSDARRTAPERLRTILRQPVAPAAGTDATPT